MTAPQDDSERARIQRRRHRHERQAALFGILIAGLAVAALGGAAIFTETIPSPFARDFTTASPDAGASTSPPPCPPDGTLPVAYPSIQVNVLNSTTRPGLASEAAGALTDRGFTILSTANSGLQVSGVARIGFGAAGLGAAYTLSAQLKGAVLVLDTRTDASVDLAVGTKFTALLDPASVTLDPATPLTGAAGCVPLADAVSVPIPTPVAPTTDPKAAAG